MTYALGDQSRAYPCREREISMPPFLARGFHGLLEVRIQMSQGLKRKFSVANSEAQVTISYDPAQRYFSMNQLGLYCSIFGDAEYDLYRARGQGYAIKRRLNSRE